MASKWTVTPDVDRYDLEYDGEAFWIELKKRLNTGEKRRIAGASFRSWSRREGAPVSADAENLSDFELNVNFESAVFEKVRVWMADWSLTDDRGVKLPRSVDTFRALNDVYLLIEKTIDVHAERVAEQEKKVLTDGTTTTTSPAPSKT